MFGSGWEWIVIGAALFLLFGASRLPQLAKSLGQSRRAFREGMREAEEEFEAEKEKKQLEAKAEAPNISTISDDELLAEMRRRAESAKK
jgi:sec-independent protein translocase protein TatA